MAHDRRAPRPEIVEELVAALVPHPGGLRRRSVMRAIRIRREAMAHEVPLKLETDVERIFREFCRGDGGRTSGRVLFCRLAERAGEVWALDTGYDGAGTIASRK